MQKWDYLIFTSGAGGFYIDGIKQKPGADVISRFKEFGQEGWELTTVVTTDYGTTYIFKKPLEGTEDPKLPLEDSN